MTRLPRTYKAENHAIIPWDRCRWGRGMTWSSCRIGWGVRSVSLSSTGEAIRCMWAERLSLPSTKCWREWLVVAIVICKGLHTSKCRFCWARLKRFRPNGLKSMSRRVRSPELPVDPERKKKLDRKWVYRFLSRWQWSYQESNTKGAYLADDSQEMKEMRLAHRAQRLAHNVPWTLCLNFDQLWRSSYEPPSKVLHKRRAKEATRQGEDFGEVRPSDLQGKKLNTVLNIVKDAMTERMGQTTRASKLRKTCARSEHVQGGRVGVTAVSSTWASGEIGPLGICVATGALPLSFIKSMNQEWYGHCFIFESGTESHFMTADTTILYLQELIGPVACFEFSKDDWWWNV